MAGYLVDRLDRILDVGDAVEFDAGRLEVAAMAGTRVTAVAFAPRPPESGVAEE